MWSFLNKTLGRSFRKSFQGKSGTLEFCCKRLACPEYREETMYLNNYQTSISIWKNILIAFQFRAAADAFYQHALKQTNNRPLDLPVLRLLCTGTFSSTGFIDLEQSILDLFLLCMLLQPFRLFILMRIFEILSELLYQITRKLQRKVGELKRFF